MEILPVRIWFCGALILFQLILNGCSEPSQTLQPPIYTITSTQQLETSFVPTDTVSPFPTITATPTVTKISLPTVTASPTYLPTNTPTFLPSLEPTQAIEVIQRFLSHGMDCQSPCFLGIIPGKTSIEQAVNILTRLRASPLSPTTQHDNYYTSLEFKDDKSIFIFLELANKVVKNIELSIGLDNQKEAPVEKIWRGFSPDVLLKKYGNLTQVGIDLVFSPSPPDSPSENIHYNLILYFEPLDLTVEYELGLIKDDRVLKICPLTDRYEGMRIFLGKDPANRPDFRLSLEKASSLTLEQFSDLMTQKSEPACFDVSKEAFYPTP
jgi:hypothetical protein